MHIVSLGGWRAGIRAGLAHAQSCVSALLCSHIKPKPRLYVIIIFLNCLHTKGGRGGRLFCTEDHCRLI